MSEYNKIDLYLETNLEKSLEELGKLVAQPSISAQGIGLKECASLVADMPTSAGAFVGRPPPMGAAVAHRTNSASTGLITRTPAERRVETYSPAMIL